MGQQMKKTKFLLNRTIWIARNINGIISSANNGCLRLSYNSTMILIDPYREFKIFIVSSTSSSFKIAKASFLFVGDIKYFYYILPFYSFLILCFTSGLWHYLNTVNNYYNNGWAYEYVMKKQFLILTKLFLGVKPCCKLSVFVYG